MKKTLWRVQAFYGVGDQSGREKKLDQKRRASKIRG